MIEIINNVNNLREEEMTDFVKKLKLLLVNSKGELLLGYSQNEYQFPGGTQESGETLIDTVNRELKEETGIELNLTFLEPFACNIGYYRDWPLIGRNKKVEIYYYEIKTDKEPNLDKINLTENEKNGNFELRYVPLSTVEDELDINAIKCGDPHGIAKEMINLLNIYKDNINS